MLESKGFTLIAGLMDENHAKNIIPLHKENLPLQINEEPKYYQ